MACKTFDCRCKSKVKECPSCERLVHTAGTLISRHPGCRRGDFDAPAPRYVLKGLREHQKPA